MKWLAATNLLPDSSGVLEFIGWVAEHQTDDEQDEFRALTIARDGDYFTATEHTKRRILEGLKAAMQRSVDASPARKRLTELRTRTAGSIAAAVSRDAEAVGAVLVLGRAAPSESRRLIRLGAITRRVIRRLTTPVVVVPPDWTGDAAGCGPVLVAIDPTEPSLAAINFGQRLASRVGRPHAMAHVLPGVEEVGLRYLAATDATQIRRDHAENASAALRQFLAAHGHAPASVHTVTGPKIEALLELATELDALAVVCGSRQLSAGQRLFSASVGSELAAMAARPVGIVPSTGVDDRLTTS